MTILSANDKCSPRVTINRPNGNVVPNINSIDIDTMQGMEVIHTDEIRWKPIDLSDCTITIGPLKHEMP